MRAGIERIIHIGTDHAGLQASQLIQRHLKERGFDVHDHGPSSYDPTDDYPAFCIATAEAVVADQKRGHHALGIVLGNSGNGEQIAANKVDGVRAALVWNHEIAVLSRQHNDANVMGIGASQHDTDELLSLVDAFVDEPFSNEERHIRRIGQIAQYEHDRYARHS